MTEQLRLTGKERVLEIGTGSGYQAAILAELAAKVYSIEIRPELAREAAERLRALGIRNVEVRTADGYRGWPEEAPFDGIVVTAAPERVPPPLLEQLAATGRMVIPVGAFYQELKVIERQGGGYSEKSVLPVRFVPVRGRGRGRAARPRSGDRPLIRRALAAALAASLLSSAPALAQEAAPPAPPPPVFTWSEAGALAAGDATGVLLAPLHWDGTDWLKFGGATAAVVATGFLLDNTLRDASQRSRTTSRDDAASAIECFGAGCSFAVLGVFAIVGVAAKDRAAMNVAVDGALASVIASGIVAPVSKLVVGRARPNAEEGPDHFRPFSGDASFPSGHTTQAFAVASVIAAHDGRLWVSVVSYGLAGSVGFARIEQDAHWASDVLAGAILGTAVGNAVVRVNDRIRAGRAASREGTAVAIAPVFLRKGGGLSVTASF